MEKISVGITCYKQKKLLHHAFTSLEAQTDKNFEIIIVNDASPDPVTNSICRELELEKNVRVIWRSENGGVAAVGNTGYAAITGDICVPLDGDDILPPNAIADIREGFRQNPNVDFVFGDYIRRDVDRNTEHFVSCSPLCSPNGLLNPMRLTGRWGLLGTSPCRKAAWQRIGGYHQEFSYDLVDVDFWMRLLLAGGRGVYVGKTIYEWNRLPSGISRNLSEQSKLRLRERNIVFYDTFGNGGKTRRILVRNYIGHANFNSARRVAGQSIDMGYMSFTLLIVAIFPPVFTRNIISVFKKVRSAIVILHQFSGQLVNRVSTISKKDRNVESKAQSERGRPLADP